MNARDEGKQAAALVYAVRPLVVLRFTGQICWVLALLSLVPLLVAAMAGELAVSLSYGAVVVLLVGIGVVAMQTPTVHILQTNEALVITALVFCLAAALLALPMYASGLAASDAVFEAVSAVTTTGLSAAGRPEEKSWAFAFGRAWAQWYGGLGMVVLSLALIYGPGIASRQLSGQGVDQRDLIGNTRTFARTSLVTYALITGAGIGLLMLAGADAWTAVLHALAAVSTGGFSPYSDSLAALSWAQRYTVTFVCVLGAVPLVEYRLFLPRRDGRPARRVQLPALATALLVSVVGLAVVLYWADGFSVSGSVAHALLLGVSAQTTAGFSSLEVQSLTPGARFVLMASMFVGGGLGSTAGGIKILRAVVVLRVVQVLVRRTCLPHHAVLDPRFGGQRLEADEIQQILTLVLLFFLVVAVSWAPFLAYGYDPLAALFEVVAATATVGLSSGISSPDLPLPLKAVLCADMLLGRLEVVAFLVLFYPKTWQGHRLEAS